MIQASIPIVNLAELEYHPSPIPLPEALQDRYAGARLAPVASRLGAQKLGYNVTSLPPGKRAFPLHNHRVNEEMFFILDGEGEVRIGSETFPIRQGDVIAHPPGGPETAHQIINTAKDAELKFLAVSTKLSPDIAEYPDSRKFGVLAELQPGPDGKPQHFRFVGRADQSLNYWEGE
jgi:uncharacterized cupin superfamily protein